MAAKVYLKLTGVTGDSTDDGRAGWFDVLSFEFAIGTGRFASGVGRPGEFTVLVPYGRGALSLRNLIATGQRVRQAALDAIRIPNQAAAKPVKFLTYTFADLGVVGYSPDDGGGPPNFSVTFGYGNLANGSPQAAAQLVRPQDRGRMMAAAKRRGGRTTATP